MPRYVPEDSMLSPRFTGPTTFARLPYIRTLEDVDLAIVGVPFDTGVTYRVGGRFGPSAVRTASVMLRPYNANLDVSPFEILSCVDYGDVAIVPGYTERSYAAIEAAIAPIVEAGVVPLLIGGDHACTLPHLRATRSRGPVAVIDFDSHTDAWDSYFGEKHNHGTWMRRAIEEGLVDTAHSIEVGLRGSLYGAEDWTGLRTELGLDYLTTEDVFALGPAAVAARIRERVGDRPAYITFDIDVVDPAYAPGTGTPEAGGPSAHDLLAILRLLTGIDFVGFDVVEVIPAYDPAGQTATLAANLAFEMLSLVARHRRAAERPMTDGAPREPWRSPMPAGFRWPDGIRAAACFSFDVDAESPILVDHPEAAGWLDVMSHQAYGPRTGVPRLLRLLDRQRRPGDLLRARLHGRALAGMRPVDPRRGPRDRPPRLPPRGRPVGAGRGDRGAAPPARPRGARRGGRRPPDRLPGADVGAVLPPAGAPRAARLPLRQRADGR